MLEYIDYKHEKIVNNFLSSMNVSSAYLYYSNFKFYADVKHLLKNPIVSHKDKKTFEKFCRHWIVTQGVCDIKWLTKIKNMLKYYSIKQKGLMHNSTQKQLRLTKRV